MRAKTAAPDAGGGCGRPVFRCRVSFIPQILTAVLTKTASLWKNSEKMIKIILWSGLRSFFVLID